MDTEVIDLIKKSLQGNTDSFSQLVRSYANAVYVTAIHRLGDPHEAEDVAQEVFVKVWYNLSKLQDPNKFNGWLLTIARNTATDVARKKKPTVELEDEAFIGNAENFTEETWLRREKQQTVWKALGELDEKYRIIITQYYLGGYTALEISKLFGLSLSSVESRLRRAKKMLKKELVELSEQVMNDQKLGSTFVAKVMEELEDITGMTCIYVPVSDVDKAVQFYDLNLGCKPAIKEATHAILRFPEQNGEFLGPRVRQTVPAIFLVHSKSSNSQIDNSIPIGCFITPRIQKMYNRFKENGVEIVSEIPENRPCGPNFLFRDLDGNMWEIWEAS